MQERNIYKDILFGVVVGDTIGVPTRFKDYDTHHVPAGSFSDDAALTFCLAEALTKPFQLLNVATNFVDWLNDNYWSYGGFVFDVEVQTSRAIRNLVNGVHPELAGGEKEDDNGNGSLTRILPLLIYIHDKPIEERFRITQQVSSLTHRHIRSIIACFYYLEFARGILNQEDKFAVYKKIQTTTTNFLHHLSINKEEIKHFDRLLTGNIYELTAGKISSGNAVVDTLEASIWCFLNTNSYEEAVLKALKLGADKDTGGIVTGGLAGLQYGFENIPDHWVQALARREDIEDLTDRIAAFQNKERAIAKA